MGLLYILRGLRDIGEDIGPLLDKYGLDLDTLDLSAQVDRSVELKIYVEAAEQLRDPLAGLKAGTYIGFAGYGPFTMLLLTATNAYEAFRTGIEYQQLTYLYGSLHFEPGPDLSALVLTPLPLAGKAFRFRVDGEASGTFKLFQDMQAALGLNLKAERIELPYPRPAEAEAYEAYYGCTLQFDAPAIRFWMRNEYLQTRFPTADATAHQFYRAQCDQLLQAQAQAARRERLADRVESHLALFTEDFPDAAAVAATFGQAERSFRRQLSEEGESFRAILERVRFAKAKQLLTNQLPVEQVARLLGYAESSAFIHAFKRWAGQSPAAFRRSLGAPGAEE